MLPFAITWVDLEDIMLSEMSDKDKYCMSFICENQKPQQNSEYNKKETDSQLQQTKQRLPVEKEKEEETRGCSVLRGTDYYV